ncbi:MAG TPA: hypothetical protein VF316_08145 [Polyangiaceae bacterium]
MRRVLPIVSLGFALASCGQITPEHVGEGHLSIRWFEDPTYGARHDVSGSFLRDPQRTLALSPGCTSTAVDGCTFVSCPPTPPPITDAGGPIGSEQDDAEGGAGTPGPSYATSGKLTISGLLPASKGSITIAAPARGRYEDQGARKLWNGGETIRITTEGAEVPAFDQYVVAPTPVDLTSPTMVDGLAVDRTKPLRFAWNGTTAGRVQLVLQNYPHGDLLTCVRPTASGEAQIDASTLGLVSSGAVYVMVTFQNEIVTTESGWTLTTVLENFPAGDNFVTAQFF